MLRNAAPAQGCHASRTDLPRIHPATRRPVSGRSLRRQLRRNNLLQKSSRHRWIRLQARLHHWLTRPSPARYVALGYLGYMLAGWVLLALPMSQALPLPALDSLFIAVSAVSTTGLATVDPGTSFTFFGQVVILALIQVGGLGFMTIGSFAWAALAAPVAPAGLRDRVARLVFSVSATEDVRRFLRRVAIYSLVVEGLGALALYPLFRAAGVADPAWSALFHSVSAFCTAGFSLFPDSLERFSGNALVLSVIALLSMLGAIGFLVASEVWDRLRGRRAALGLTARLVLRTLPLMILAGAALLLATEPAFATRSWADALGNALFQTMSATTTVGFNSMPLGGVGMATTLLLCAAMLVGASPSGTGGGLKVTTLGVLLALLRATARGEAQVRLLGRAVREEQLRQAATILVAAVMLIGLAMYALLLTETLPFERLLFEALSALGTVGLSLGATGELSPWGKAIIIALMAVGRIGVLGFAVAIAARVRQAERAAATAEEVAL